MITTSEQAILAAILVCIAGAGLVWLLPRHRLGIAIFSFAIVLGSALFAGYAAIRTLTSGTADPASFWAIERLGFALRLHVDGLTAVFLILVAVVAVPASLYSIGYLRGETRRNPAYYHTHFLLFLAAMYGLVSTTDMMWFFFIFWQLMTMPGYALIRFEKENPAHRRAANQYLVMMQIACVVTMIGAEILAHGGAATSANASKYDIHSVSQNLPVLLQQHPLLAAIAFALFLIGFGIKMGMWPFGQIWLPDAHPAAPSPVSAMLSGVMIKTGVYGLIRYFLWLVPEAAHRLFPLGQWGIVIALLGTITLLTGTWRALSQTQSKRLLAFHSIGQIGYILLGAGVCMILLPTDQTALVAVGGLALFGALLHTFNHGVFKGLLFLNAGSLLHITGTQDLNRMGGLLRFMPWTAAATLVAALSISGIPLFNGFISKWSIYVSAIQGSAHAGFLAACAFIALVTAALTLASFIKFFGASFLSSTSPLVRERVQQLPHLEVPWSMRIPQIFLASLCLLVGLLPVLAVQSMRAALDSSRHGFGPALADSTVLVGSLWPGLRTPDGHALFAPLALLIILLLIVGALLLVVRLVPGMSRITPPWLCGYVQATDENRYVAHHLYGELKGIVSPTKPGSRSESPHADS